MLSRRKFITRSAAGLASAAGAHTLAAQQAGETSAAVYVNAGTGALLNSFDPDRALGSSMDILPYGVVDKIYTAPMVKQCLSAGWGPISYRQNTELRMAAWHWNHEGTWSDAADKSGYFTGDAEPSGFLRHSYSYPLPRRGNTRNGGSEYGYSRMTDGDSNTYWKSNPYLTEKFTGEADALHPQWVVIDLSSVEPVDAIRVAWADPYARVYEVQYWVGKTEGSQEPMDRPTEGVWKTFPQGKITAGKGGAVTLKLSMNPVPARFLRIWMTESSHTSVAGASEDPRNSLGYAIREVYVGSFTNGNEFVDLIQHSPGQNQTATYCSSIDPWHSASDLNEHAGDQTGFDLVFTSGITNHLPAMIPVAMLYGTPENSAAQVAFLEKRGYPISYVEMGEEPDGQYMLPEDYGALYIQWSDAIHKVNPDLKLGGPVFEGVNEDIKVWPDARGKTSWMGRFLDYLKARNRLSDLTFMSLEHYPFSACGVTWSDLYREPEITSHILQVWHDDGLPANVPIFITESNLAPALTHEMVDVFAALWLADSVGSFFAAGGKAYYHSPIQPEPLRRGCHGWGTYGNFVADTDLHIRAYTSQYFASRLINREWVQHGSGMHQMFSANCDLKDDAGHLLVTTYAVRRPDKTWSVLLVNKDQSNTHRARISVRGLDNGAPRSFSGPVTVISFGSEQYRWRGEGADSRPDPDGPPVRSVVPANEQTLFTLPKASITVIRGNLSA